MASNITCYFRTVAVDGTLGPPSGVTCGEAEFFLKGSRCQKHTGNVSLANRLTLYDVWGFKHFLSF